MNPVVKSVAMTVGLAIARRVWRWYRQGRTPQNGQEENERRNY